MSFSLLPLTKFDKFSIKKTFLNSPLLFLLGLLCIIFFFLQTLTIFVATLSGSLLSLYLLQSKTHSQKNLENMNSLLQLKKWISLVISCNEQLHKHRSEQSGKATLPWEIFIGFYHFKTLPSFNVKDINFLLDANGEMTQLYDAFVVFQSHLVILSNAINELQKHHTLYLEKMNHWESKIKTMKAIREMNSSDSKILREKMGDNLFQQLIFLTNLCTEKSDCLNIAGSDLFKLLEYFGK